MNSKFLALLPVFIFMITMLAVSVFLRKSNAKKESQGFVKEYFIGSRSLGGFVLAMTTVATYSSVSSFVGGPGQAWSVGFGWIYMSVVQVTALFLVLGVLGKKMAIVGRKIDAVTVIDVIRHRYQSDAIAMISAVISSDSRSSPIMDIISAKVVNWVPMEAFMMSIIILK